MYITGVYKILGNSSFSPDAIINQIDGELNTNFDQWGNFNFGLLLKIHNKDNLNRLQTQFTGYKINLIQKNDL